MPGQPGGQPARLDHDQYLALQFAPAGMRGDLTAIFDLDIALGRVEQLVSEPLTGEMRLAWWRETLDPAQPGRKTGNPLADRIVQALLAHDLPFTPVEAMIEARRLELYNQPVTSLDELTVHFADTLGATLELACRVLAPAPTPAGHAALCAQAGLVLGMTRMIGQLVSGPMATTPRLVPADILVKVAGGSLHQSLTPQIQDKLIAGLIIEARNALDSLQGRFENLPMALLPVFLPLVLVSGDLSRYARCSAATEKFIHGLPRYRRVIKLASCGLRGHLL